MNDDKRVQQMPQIRINANKTMYKYRLKQEEIENQKKRIKQVEVSDYIQRPDRANDDFKQASGLYEPAVASFRFNKDASHLKILSQNLLKNTE